MSDVYVGRFNRYFEKLFNIKGGPAVVDVEGAIRGVVQMTNPPTEDRYITGIESFGAGGSQPAVAGNKSAFMLRNPLGSNVIAVVEKITVACSAGSNVILAVAGSNPADLANLVTPHNRADPRGRSVSTCVASSDAPAVDPGTGFLVEGTWALLTGSSFDFILAPNQEIVLLPQIALRVVVQTVNLNLQWTCWFRERPLETSELT